MERMKRRDPKTGSRHHFFSTWDASAYASGKPGTGHSSNTPGAVAGCWTLNVDETANREKNRNDIVCKILGGSKG